MRSQLPLGWVRWRRRRFQQIAEQGLASHLAWDVAAAEAKRRHALARIIGKEAAEEAELMVVGGKIVLSGTDSNLTQHQLRAIQALNT